MKIAIVLGTRPEIIKMSPVIRECARRGLDYFVLHTGQHYSHNLDRIFFEELELPMPRYNLNVGSGTHAQETGRMLIGIEELLKREKPDVVLVQGDTNTVLAGALAASKLHIAVGHVEAGLRSYDRQMPEELNRVLTDHISDYLFAPTKKAEQNLLREGIDAHSISITGNTVVDALFQSHEISKRSSQVLDTLGLKAGQYILLTAHREENVDSPQRFEGIMSGLALVHDQLDLPIIYPVHPRAEKKVHEFGLDVPSGVEMVATVGFLDFLQLESGARLILTDSGGVQEESCILGVPCITLRENTERPETVEVGSNVLAGTHPESIVEAVKEMLDKKRGWNNPFGDGRAGERIISILEAAL